VGGDKKEKKKDRRGGGRWVMANDRETGDKEIQPKFDYCIHKLYWAHTI